MDMDVHPKYPKWLPAFLRKGYSTGKNINQTFSSQLNDDEALLLLNTEGHITPRQCATLFYFAFIRDNNGKIVEIGSFKGKSTVFLAKALQKTNSSQKLFAIDPHINTRDNQVVPNYQESSSYAAFMENLEKAEIKHLVQPIVKTSVEAAKQWNDKINLLFIDGSHKYEDVQNDLKLWLPHLTKKGIVIMHDTKPTGAFPGVRKAMNEYLSADNNYTKIIELLNLTVFKKSN